MSPPKILIEGWVKSTKYREVCLFASFFKRNMFHSSDLKIKIKKQTLLNRRRQAHVTEAAHQLWALGACLRGHLRGDAGRGRVSVRTGTHPREVGGRYTIAQCLSVLTIHGKRCKRGTGVSDEENRGTVCRCGTTGTLSGDLQEARQVRAEGRTEEGGQWELAVALGPSPQRPPHEAQGALTP